MRHTKSNPILVLDDLEASMMLAGSAASQRKNAAARKKRQAKKNEAFMLGYRVGSSKQTGRDKHA